MVLPNFAIFKNLVVSMKSSILRIQMEHRKTKSLYFRLQIDTVCFIRVLSTREITAIFYWRLKFFYGTIKSFLIETKLCQSNQDNCLLAFIQQFLISQELHIFRYLKTSSFAVSSLILRILIKLTKSIRSLEPRLYFISEYFIRISNILEIIEKRRLKKSKMLVPGIVSHS